MTTRRHLLRLAAVAPALAWAAPAFAAFPDRPIRVIVPFAAGGNGDVMARLAAPRMAEKLGQPVVVENRAGGGGVVGAEVIARSRPDGYNLVWGAGGPLVNGPLLMLNPRYDPVKDFAPVGLMSLMPMVIVVRPGLPVRNLRELVEYSKRPGNRGVTIGTSGVGGANHVPLELFKTATGANLEHVPYRGGGAAIPDLLAGNVDGLLTEFSTVLDMHKEGRARILGITSVERSSLVPDVQTFIEFGLADFTAFTFSGIWAPANTPADVVARLQAALAAVVEDSAVLERLSVMGAVPATPEQRTPAGAAAYLNTEIARARRAIELAGIKPE
jgi:tripartite-type tricarboxylate transporter receptor subunit TctC